MLQIPQYCLALTSHDSPNILATVAELGTCHRSRQWVVRKTDLLVNVLIGKIVLSSGHSTNENAYTLILVQCFHVVLHSSDLGIKTQGDFAALNWQVVCDGVLITLSNFSSELTRRMLSLCNSWTIKPENLLKVLGILTLGLTSINTPLAV